MDPERETPQTPQPHEVLAYQRTFDAAQAVLIRRGYQAQQMEDKWNLRFEGSQLFCVRSWTGYCVFVVEFEAAANGGLVARRILASRDTTHYNSPGAEDDIASVSFLIDRLLLGTDDAAPPANADPLSTWSSFGRAMLPDADINSPAN